uniref:HD domain-containing protein n=1 Tax=Caldilinea aerophila TaxID=133453 RepID=A0A7C1FK31_9CHLR
MTESLLSVEEARLLYQAGDAAHDFDHVLRVACLAERIAAAEGADVAVVRLAALLHDLPAFDKSQEPAADRRNAHHLHAADCARCLLRERGASSRLIEQVAHCIAAHRYRDETVQPQTLEAQCLYDADKLDAIGAIGVARAFAYAGAQGNRLWCKPASSIAPTENDRSTPGYTPVHEYVFKLRRLLDSLHTPTGRAIGRRRHATMVAFFEHLDAEMAETFALSPEHLLVGQDQSYLGLAS